MASIQQSYNQLLGALAGATTAGSYMYRQSGTYHAKKADKAANELEKTSRDYENNIKGEITPEQGQTIIDLDKGVSELRKGALMSKPNADRAKNYKNALTRQDISETEYSKEGIALGKELTRRPHKVVQNEKTGEWEVQFLDEEAPATPKAKAEAKGLERLTASTEAQLTQREELKNRFEFLKAFSAKERGQFETAYNRHKNKGEID